MKKLFSVILCTSMVASLVAGCGGGQKPDNAENGGSAAAQGTIKVAALETGYGAAMWGEVCEAFTAETGIKVELTTDKKLEDVIGPSMQGGDYPDVIHLATGREAALTEQFIKGNLIEEVTDVLSMQVPGEEAKVSDKIAGGFTDTSLTNPYGDGKTYLMPMFYSPCGLFYNAGLLEQKGWSVPSTWEEMWELGEKAKAEGISLFTYPTTGYFDTFFYALMYSVGGPEFFDKATHYEEGIWETPEAQKCFDIIAKLASYTNPITPAQANDIKALLCLRSLQIPSWSSVALSKNCRSANGIHQCIEEGIKIAGGWIGEQGNSLCLCLFLPAPTFPPQPWNRPAFCSKKYVIKQTARRIKHRSQVGLSIGHTDWSKRVSTTRKDTLALRAPASTEHQ